MAQRGREGGREGERERERERERAGLCCTPDFFSLQTRQNRRKNIFLEERFLEERFMDSLPFLDKMALQILTREPLGIGSPKRYRRVGFSHVLMRRNITATLLWASKPVHHHHHQSLNREGRWGTTDDFATSFLHFPLFSAALWDLPSSRPVHSLMSSHLFLCLPCLLHPFTVPCKRGLARPDEWET